MPPLPEKQAVARFSQEFIEDRRVRLERFLRRVVMHPELGDAPSLDIFLQADDITFHHIKNSKGVHDTHPNSKRSSAVDLTSSDLWKTSDIHLLNPAAAAKKDGFKKWIAEAKTTFFHSSELVQSPDDDLFEEIHTYVDALERQMKQVTQASSALVDKGRAMAQGLFEMGHAFALLGQAEADELGLVLVRLGQAADQLSTLAIRHSQLEHSSFEVPLDDHLKTIQAIKAALQKRQELRVTYTTALTEVAAKASNLQRLRMTPNMDAKAYGAQLSLKKGEDYAEMARDEYATVSQRVLREIDRFKRQSADDMRWTVFQYIQLQIDYNKTMEKIWGDLIPELEKIKPLYQET
jgi:sorting nexin-1/2